MHIASVEKLPLTTTGSPLLIRCKTFLSVTFVIAKERDSHDVYSTLIKLCQPGKFPNNPQNQIKKVYFKYLSHHYYLL
jgi:myotubularin-related protein 6/7/8